MSDVSSSRTKKLKRMETIDVTLAYSEVLEHEILMYRKRYIAAAEAMAGNLENPAPPAKNMFDLLSVALFALEDLRAREFSSFADIEAEAEADDAQTKELKVATLKARMETINKTLAYSKDLEHEMMLYRKRYMAAAEAMAEMAAIAGMAEIADKPVLPEERKILLDVAEVALEDLRGSTSFADIAFYAAEAEAETEPEPEPEPEPEAITTAVVVEASVVKAAVVEPAQMVVEPAPLAAADNVEPDAKLMKVVIAFIDPKNKSHVAMLKGLA
jgi:hypothetical protein